MTVAINADLVLAGDVDEAGTPGWFCTTLGDWDTVPESKSEVRERPQAGGAFTIARDWRKSLPFSIKGLFSGDTRDDVQSAKRLLKATAAIGTPVNVTVTDVDGPMRRAASVRAVVISDPGETDFTFTIDLVAFDPLMYGPDQSFTTGVPISGGGLLFPFGMTPTAYWDFGADGASGRVAFTNTGTAPTWGTLRATGGLGAGFTATDVDTGQTVQFERVIPDGSVVQINQRTGRAWIDSPANDVSGFLTVRDFFEVGPGETHQIQFAPLGAVTGTPQFTFTAASANR